MPIQPTLATLLMTALTLSAGACSSTQERAPEPVSSEQTPIEHESWRDLGYQWDWTGYPILGDRAALTEAVVYDDRVITIGSDTAVCSLDARTGKVQWAKRLDRLTTQLFEPTREGDTLWVTSDTDLYELDITTGNTLDRDAVGAIINTPPVIVRNLALMGTTRNEIVAFQTDLDFSPWKYSFDGAILSKPATVTDRVVAAVSEGGDIRVIDAVTGSSPVQARIDGGSIANILVDNGVLFIASTDQSLYAFEADSGRRLWRKRTSAPLVMQPVLIDGVIYTTTVDDGLAAFDASTGDTVWSNADRKGWVVTTNDDELLVWDGTELAAIDMSDGSLITATDLSGVIGLRADSTVDGNLYAINDNASVSRFTRR